MRSVLAMAGCICFLSPLNVYGQFEAGTCSQVFSQAPLTNITISRDVRQPPLVEISYQGRNTSYIRLQELIREGELYSHP